MTSKANPSMKSFSRRHVEQLEQRICLDGSVNVAIAEIPGYDGLTAMITGDEFDNSVRVQQLDINRFSIEGSFFGAVDTTVNGVDHIEVSNVRNFLFDLGNGNDNIFVNGDLEQGAKERFALNGDLKVFDKTGNSNVVLEDAIIRGRFSSEFAGGESFLQFIDSRVNGETSVLGGDATEFVGLFRSVFADAFEARLGRGNDSLWSGSTEDGLTGSRFLGDFDVKFGAGDDSAKLDESVYRGDVRIGLGDGEDNVDARNSRFQTDGDIRINAGKNADELNFEDVFLRSHSAMIRMGAGNDNVSIQGLVDSAVDANGGFIGVYGGANEDTIRVEDSILKRTTRVNGNAGDDEIYVGSSRFFGTGGLSGKDRPNFHFSGGGGVDFTLLIDLIASVEAGDKIDPIKWNDDNQDDRLIASNINVVISHSQETHEKIAELLDALRELQDLKITIDVQFIALTENFFERVGVDFDFDPTTESGSIKYRNNNSQNGNRFVGRTFVDSDLNIRLKVNSFEATVPQFGGFDFGTASSIGFAILSDIETFFFIQAAAGDERANVTTAPRVTIFNGQNDSILDGVLSPFYYF